jgi:hypothetical protein
MGRPRPGFGGRGRPLAAARRSPLEFVEKVLTRSSPLRTRRSGTPACCSVTRVPLPRCDGRAAYWYWFLVVLVVLAVANGGSAPAPWRRPRWWTRRWGRRGRARRRKPALALCTFDPLRCCRCRAVRGSAKGGLRGREGPHELPEDRDLHRVVVDHHLRDVDTCTILLLRSGARHEGNYVTGAGTDAQTLIAIGAVLELALIISNVGTAVVPYSIHKRVHEAGAVAYVTARLVECTFIAIGHRLHARHLRPPPGRAQRDRRRGRAGHLRGL